MKFGSIVAAGVLLLGTVACASGAPEETGDPRVLSQDAVRTGEPKGEPKREGQVSLLLYAPCDAAQQTIAANHCAANHPGYSVTSCQYNSSTGYVVYTYAASGGCSMWPCPIWE